MRKLVLAALAASAMTAPAFAQDSTFTGPRVEALVGYDAAKDGTDGDAGSSDGVTYGGAIGYDVQMGGAVIGAEAELTGSSVETGRDIYLGARAGVAITPTTLLYAKGGYTNARVETTYETGNSKTEIHEDMEGFRVGAGAEFKLSNNMYVKGEYRYSNYGKIDGYDIDIDRHQVVAGVGIRF
jgi:outer membrane immunogenic protein